MTGDTNDSPAEFVVVLIEDSDTDQELVTRFLRRAARENPIRFHLHAATRLDEGLNLVEEVEPDAILLDLHLPDADGLPAVDQTLTVASDIAVVVLTGLDDREVALESLRHGADDYLRKEGLNAELLVRSLLFSIERSRHRVTDRAVAREREARLQAGRVQANLLPKATPRIPGFDIAGAYRPADKIGGDLFDVLTMPDGDVLCHVADVSGHDVGSALTMAGLRRVVRSLSPRLPSLAELCTAINEAVYEDTDPYQFVTQFLLRLHPAENRFTYVGAAHIGYVLRASGQWERLVSQIPPFGVLEELPEFEPVELSLAEEDIVVVPTDGFVEAMDPTCQLWGSRRLEDAVRAHRNETAERMVATLMDMVLDYCAPGVPADDCSVIVLKVDSADALDV